MANNLLQKAVGVVNKLPERYRPFVLSLIMGTAVKFAGTAKIRVEKLTADECIITLKNRKKVQNHIGSVHAAAAALIAESATGFMTALSISDDRLIILKSMSLQYTRRSSGNMKAVARLSEEDLAFINNTPKGDLKVPVTITDETGEETITAEIIWAWTLKK